MTVADNPIEEAIHDRLERRSHAWAFADQLLRLDASKGLVASVYGPWGSGKTSYINFMRHRLEHPDKHVVIDYNPWMFSGADQLVESFFHELSAQLKLEGSKFSEIGEQVAAYGEMFSGLGWLPVVGVWVERARLLSKLGKLASKNRDVSAAVRRKELEVALAALDKPIFVVLDDVDRLSPAEIRDIFKLVRVTAHFPNIIYLLAFDRLYAEAALADHDISGRLYLEKIVQVGTNLPEASQTHLTDLTLEGLNEVIAGTEFLSADDRSRFSSAYHSVVKPLIRNVRDVRRYCLAADGAVGRLGGQMSLTDLLVMEAVRTFMPETYGALRSSSAALTTIGSSIGGTTHQQQLYTETLEKLRDASENPAVAAPLLGALFPASDSYLGNYVFGMADVNEWLVDRRVAHASVLALYYEGSVGKELSKHLAATDLWLSLEAPAMFSARLHDMGGLELRDSVLALEAFQKHFRPHHAVPAIAAIASNMDRMPTDHEAFEPLRPAVILRRLTRLFLSVVEADELASTVEAAMGQTSGLGAQLLILDAATSSSGGEHAQLDDEALVQHLKSEWLKRVQAAPSEALAAESALVMVLRRARELDPSLSVQSEPGVTLALLRSAYHVSTSLTLGGSAQQTSHSDRLDWDSLCELLGSESEVAQRATAAEPFAVDGLDSKLVALALKYASGWSPAS